MSKDDPINSIFFEHQEAALCAQHALNMLLQDALYKWQDLRDLAIQMDKMEQQILGNANPTPGRSENMNESGYFSIQVLEKALETFSLKLTNIENPAMVDYKNNPLTARAYICNLREHWFVLRKFGNQWFELNSVNRGPKLLSDTYVSMFLHQVSSEGYSIFVVQGVLPRSDADDLISLCPVVPPKVTPKKEQKLEKVMTKFFNTVGKRLGGGSGAPPDSQEEKDLAIAFAMSMETKDGSEVSRSSAEIDEENLRKAIELSQAPGPSEPAEIPLLTRSRSSTPPGASEPFSNAEQQRRDRQKFLERFEKKKEERNDEK